MSSLMEIKDTIERIDNCKEQIKRVNQQFSYKLQCEDSNHPSQLEINVKGGAVTAYFGFYSRNEADTVQNAIISMLSARLELLEEKLKELCKDYAAGLINQ